MQTHYKGYCITKNANGSYKIEGFTNTFYGEQLAKAFIDLMAGATKVNEHCKPSKPKFYGIC